MYLKKELSWWDCSAIIVGIIIGTGIFSIFPKLIAEKNISTGMILLAWFAGGIFAWFGAMCYAELSSLFPHAGGDYTFLHKAYSLKGENLVSFLFGWSQIIVIRPASIVILALIFGKEMQIVFPNFSGMIWNPPFVFGLALLIVTTLINILGISAGKHTQNVMTVIKIGILLFLIVNGLIKSFSMDVASNLQPFFLPENKNLWSVFPGFISAIVLVMWVYGGWNEAAYVAEEVRNPHRDIPKALFVGIFSVMILYLGINYVFIVHFSPAVMAKSYSPASDLMGMWYSEKGRVIMSSIIMISAAGAVNGLIMTGGRMIYGIAKSTESLFSLSKLHPRFKTPVMPLGVNFVLALILIVISKGDSDFVDSLGFYTAGVYWYFFALVVITLIIIRTKLTNVEIPYKVPFYPLSPIVFLIVSGILIWGAFDYKPFETLVGISLLTVGIPLYYLMHFNRPENSLHLDNVEELMMMDVEDRRKNLADRRQNKVDRRKQNLGREAASDYKESSPEES
ncbi:MAG: amino acid permease [Candidatus Aureabacteria bacterium]|nr:amino acid permease [Candidatus Auribacterota bacterium]